MTSRRRARGIAVAGFALLALTGATLGQEAPAGPDAEEAADFARRAALSALHGPPRIFLESIDSDGLLQRLLGSPVWLGLTARQRELLRAAVREEFVQALAPVAGASADIAWASVGPSGAGPVFVDLGLRYGPSILKTRWTVRHTPKGWTIEDIRLVDPGLSLAAEVGRLLGSEPARRRDTAHEARARALPRLAGIGAIAAVALVALRRLPPARRGLVWLAGVPALLLAVDGALAVRRALSEPYALVEAPPGQDWRPFEKLALEAQSDGRTDAARAAWARALQAGAPAAPVAYRMGLASRARGDTVQAREDFERALSLEPPAPGAARELATLALSQRRYADALGLLQRYLHDAGPDPDSLAALAVIQSNLGDPEAAVRTIQAARALVGEGWRKAELEAQVYARSGNAAAAVAALRPIESEGRLDRSVLRAEPAYLPIATEAAWVAFLAEPPAATATPAAPLTTPSPR